MFKVDGKYHRGNVDHDTINVHFLHLYIIMRIYPLISTSICILPTMCTGELIENRRFLL